MQLELVNPFVEASYDTVREFLQGELRRSDITLLDKDSLIRGVAVKIGFRFKKDSAIILNMEEAVATKVASTLLGEEFKQWDDLAVSALGELGNMLSGRAVTKLEGEQINLDIDPPDVIFTRERGTLVLSDEAMNVILDTNVGKIQVIVYLAEAFVS